MDMMKLMEMKMGNVMAFLMNSMLESLKVMLKVMLKVILMVMLMALLMEPMMKHVWVLMKVIGKVERMVSQLLCQTEILMALLMDRSPLDPSIYHKLKHSMILPKAHLLHHRHRTCTCFFFLSTHSLANFLYCPVQM